VSTALSDLNDRLRFFIRFAQAGGRLSPSNRFWNRSVFPSGWLFRRILRPVLTEMVPFNSRPRKLHSGFCFSPKVSPAVSFDLPGDATSGNHLLGNYECRLFFFFLGRLFIDFGAPISPLLGTRRWCSRPPRCLDPAFLNYVFWDSSPLALFGGLFFLGVFASCPFSPVPDSAPHCRAPENFLVRLPFVQVDIRYFLYNFPFSMRRAEKSKLVGKYVLSQDPLERALS